MVFALFQHCFLPDKEANKKGALLDVVDVVPNKKVDVNDDVTETSVCTIPSSSWASPKGDPVEQHNWEPIADASEEEDSTEEDVKVIEEHSETIVEQAETFHKELEDNGLELDEPDMDKLKEEEDFKVIETERNSLLISPTKVLVFQKALSEEEKPKLLKTIKRDSLPKSAKKKRRKRNNNAKGKKGGAAKKFDERMPILSPNKISLLQMFPKVSVPNIQPTTSSEEGEV